MGKPDVGTLILPITDKDFYDLTQQFLGIPLTMA